MTKLTFQNLILFSLFFIGLSSCSDDPKEDALAYYEALHYDVCVPVDTAVSAQNDAIGEFFDLMKTEGGVDFEKEVDKIENLRLEVVSKIESAFDKLDKIQTVSANDADPYLHVATNEYLIRILQFEENLEPSLNNLKDGLDPIEIIKFTNQLKRGEEMTESGEKYEGVKQRFRDEFGISTLDVLKMSTNHLK